MTMKLIYFKVFKIENGRVTILYQKSKEKTYIPTIPGNKRSIIKVKTCKSINGTTPL